MGQKTRNCLSVTRCLPQLETECWISLFILENVHTTISLLKACPQPLTKATQTTGQPSPSWAMHWGEALLVVPRGTRWHVFSVAAPCLWNSLPLEAHRAPSLIGMMAQWKQVLSPVPPNQVTGRALCRLPKCLGRSGKTERRDVFPPTGFSQQPCCNVLD